MKAPLFLPLGLKTLPLAQKLFTVRKFPVYWNCKRLMPLLPAAGALVHSHGGRIFGDLWFGRGGDGSSCMKVTIEIVEGLEEEEAVIRCGSLNDSIVSLQNYLSKQNDGKRCLALTDGGTDFFIPMEEICFFETEGREVRAHTPEKLFLCDYKLYELEEMLPGSFMRISKSAIANLDHIYSITRNLTASSVIEFKGSRKKTMVSRGYYKLLLERLNARRLGRQKGEQ